MIACENMRSFLCTIIISLNLLNFYCACRALQIVLIKEFLVNHLLFRLRHLCWLAFYAKLGFSGENLPT